MAAKPLVSDTIDEWTEETWKHVGDQEGAEEDVGAAGRQTYGQKVEERRDVGQHAD